MTNESTTLAPSRQFRLRGTALVSVIIALMLATLLEALDQAIVGTAMPRIVAELHGLDRYTWVVTAYVLASMTMIPVVGKLSDQFGRKGFLIFGTALFLLGSILAGAAQSMDQLILFRALQGLGSGIGIALVAAVFGDLFPPAERARWMGLFGVVYGVSTLFGPTLGGWLAEHGPLLGGLITESSRWRWVFYINLPVGLLALVVLVFALPAQRSERGNHTSSLAALRHVDFLGAILCAAATICLMLGLTLGSAQASAWSSPQVLGLLAVCAVLFIAFVLVERRAAEPILPLNLLRNQVFGMAALLSMLQMMVLMGLSLYLALFLQGVLAVSPTDAGLIMTPFSVSMVIGSTVASQLIGALKRYQVVAIFGALLMVVGTFLVTLMTPATSLLQAIIFMVLVGCGAGTFFSLPMVAAQNALPASRLGVSTAATRYLGQLGVTLGIAIVGTVVTSSMSSDLTQHLPTSQAGKMVFSTALQHGFVAALIFALIALAAAFFLKDVPFISSPAESESEARSDEEAEKELVRI